MMKRVEPSISKFRLGTVIASGVLALGSCSASATDQRAEGEAEAHIAPHERSEPTSLFVTADGQFELDGENVPRDDLQARLAAIAVMHPQPQLQFSNDAGARYGDVAFAMTAAQRVGLKRLGIIGGT